MTKQKICIIGGGLTGLVTAISLAKLNCEIDIITDYVDKNFLSNRTIAISQNNLDFLKQLNISQFLRKEAWPCSIMKLYTEIKDKKFSKIFELNNDNKQKKILYMLENSKITKLMFNKIKQIRSISLINHKTISAINNLGLLKSVKTKNNNPKYNLIIICTGNNSTLVKNLFNDQAIESSYKETSITTILKHSMFKNNTVRQIFLDNGILALLPISNTRTSIVWSVKKEIKKNNLFVKNKIKFYAKNYLRNIKFATDIEYKDLNFLLRSKYYQDRILLFGDALHMLHPFVGQGFNMTLRDLVSLEKILSEKINLGLDIGSLDVLSEFSSTTKPRNFAFSVGVNLLKNSLSLKKLRNYMLKVLNKNNFIKDVFFNIADKGFKF